MSAPRGTSVGTADTGHTCQVRDVCDADESQDCTNDQCGYDRSGSCTNDSCIQDKSGQCEGDTCRSDKSGDCLNDRCTEDKSGACSGDTCPSDTSGACESDKCTNDSSGSCLGDSCRDDSSGNCHNDRCRSDKSAGCLNDTCTADRSGACQSDQCDTDKSGACMTDQCASDQSAMCGPDTCAVTDASGPCANDTCTEDSSSSCSNDTCDVDTRKCEGDTTNIPGWDCFLDGFCPLDVPCFLDVLGSKNKTAHGSGRKTGAALKWLYKLVALLIFLPILELPGLTEAAVYHVAAGDTAGLIAALEAANANPDADTINLAAGDFVLTGPYYLADEEDAEDDYWIAGLPSIVSPITINGSDTGVTTLSRNKAADNFSIFHVAKTEVEVSPGQWEERTGSLTLNRLVMRDGKSPFGAGVFVQEGQLTVNY